MILGIGIDLVSVPRFEKALARWGDSLRQRLFTAGELAYAMGRSRPGLHLAARFAAKEAVFKALGFSSGLGFRWTDVEVTRVPGEGPRVRLRGRALAHARARSVGRVLVSLSHEGDIAVAQAVALEQAP